jgi:hypothetical protein
MEPRLQRILAIGLAATLAAGLLLWNSLASGEGFTPAILVPPLLILLAGLAVFLRSRRRDDPSGTPRRAATPAARLAAVAVAGLVAAGAVLWDRTHDQGGVRAGAGDELAPLLVLFAIVLVALVMILVKRMNADRNQRPR